MCACVRVCLCDDGVCVCLSAVYVDVCVGLLCMYGFSCFYLCVCVCVWRIDCLCLYMCGGGAAGLQGGGGRCNGKAGPSIG